jgi:hypothetical protein
MLPSFDENGGVDDAARALLDRHVELFNHGVREGDFGLMVAQFTEDAELVFEGPKIGPFHGRETIAAAYREQPPDDEISVSNARVVDGEIVVDYTWRGQPQRRAGEMRITPAGEQIARLVVTFDD